MAFCINCGQELPEGANFCANCGKAVNTITSSQRKTTYEGEIHKCPNCGEVLRAFVSVCSSCGFELRGASSSHSVASFADKLENAQSQEQRVSLIRNFPIPNTKEDILEFMILASSNFETKLDRTVSDAWLAKIEQCYQKGRLLFKDDAYFTGIQNAYDQAYEKIKNIEQQEKINQLQILCFIPSGYGADCLSS